MWKFFELNNGVVKESCKVASRLGSEGGDDVIMRSFMTGIETFKYRRSFIMININ